MRTEIDRPVSPALLPGTRVLSLALALLVLLATPLLASAQSDAATRYVRGRNDRVTEIMRRAATTDAQRTTRDEEVSAILSDLLDFDELGRRSLGAHWAEHTPAEQQQFVALLRQLVERNYRTNLEHLLEFEVSYAAESAIPEGSVVHTSARSREDRRQPAVEIDYSMHLVGTAWRVFDVNTDGVSLVRNYQQQFHRIITSDGWAGLISRMEQRLAAGSATAPTH
jgi:phospholipid transport system substrate-binding protein